MPSDPTERREPEISEWVADTVLVLIVCIILLAFAYFCYSLPE